MCYLIGPAIQQALTRRGFIAGSAVGASLIAPMICSAVADDGSLGTRTQLAQSSADVSNSRTRLILLGTAGGPTWWPNSDQCGISSVVAVGDAFYIVDCGEGVGKRLQQAISPASSRVMDDKVRALFLTHLHSDHSVDYANLLLFGLFVGLDRRSSPFKVFGPGRRGQMAPVFALPGAPPSAVPIINPENPTPGIKDMTGYLYQAFATDLNDRMRDNGKPNLEAVVEVHDIDIPPIVGFKSPNEPLLRRWSRSNSSRTIVFVFPQPWSSTRLSGLHSPIASTPTMDRSCSPAIRGGARI